jgi:hypothetical protein
MSFLGGAECSTGRNPLAQFTKHASEDRSLQRDRLSGLPVGPDAGGLRSMGGEMAGTDKQVCVSFSMIGYLQPEPTLWMFLMCAVDGIR